jgi:hypothetical protein
MPLNVFLVDVGGVSSASAFSSFVAFAGGAFAGGLEERLVPDLVDTMISCMQKLKQMLNERWRAVRMGCGYSDWCRHENHHCSRQWKLGNIENSITSWYSPVVRD